ncbi:DUF2933 domain-containing protein [Streptomyces sp. NPDC096132]|uniref:DUF2933 domain-containing protein n=1 Tax=Streptomyces sp. NPDC096132 TaxID=3366075 RepID=UPI00382145D1
MNKRDYGLYTLAAAIVIATVLIVGAPLQNLIWLAVLVACPLMMFFMMRAMHGQDMHDGPDQHRHERDEGPLHKQDHPTGPSRP